MMSTARVAVIITNYNYGEYLAEAIKSALGQTHTPAEIVVVDDGSTDDSLAVARHFPVRVISQANAGVGAARNCGARATYSDFLMFLDADDVLEGTYIERCLAALEGTAPRVAYAYTAMRLFGAESGILASKPFSRRELVRGNFVNASALIRREVFEKAGGFDLSWNFAYEDYELWMRMLSIGYEGVLVPEPLLLYRRHVSSRNTLNRGQDQDLIWRMRGTYPQFYPKYWIRRPVRLLYWMWRARWLANAANRQVRGVTQGSVPGR